MRLSSLSVLALTLAPMIFGSAPAHAVVRLAVSPETLTVTPGATFTLELRVPVAGAPFNAFDATIEYDPAMLTFLPTNPLSLQEGSSMREACGNTILYFNFAGDSLTISDVLLCNGVTLTGPAQLSVLKFRASNATAGVTHVRLRSVQFYDAGMFVDPALTSDALVQWGVILDVAPDVRTREVRLSVRSNPSSGDQWIDASSPLEGEQQLEIFDSAGRTIRNLDSGFHVAGTRAVQWDGRDHAGRLVPPGVYQARLRAAGRSVCVSLVRLP